MVEHLINLPLKAHFLMKAVISLVLLLSYLSVEAQDLFSITEMKKNFQLSKVRKRVSEVLLEDRLYVVTSTCSGEFGGSVHFTNKKTGISRSAAACCVRSVNKLKGKYYVSNSLSHSQALWRS